MTDKTKSTELPESLRKLLVKKREMERAYNGNPATPHGSFETPETLEDGEPQAQMADESSVEAAAVEFCAKLDHSDTDNGIRLKSHFGRDLLVVTQEKAKVPLYAVWTGKNWDVSNGGPKSLAIAQQLGGRIALETRYILPTEREERTIMAGQSALKKEESERSGVEKRLVAAAEKARESHGKRVKRRMDHAVSSKNIARMNAALACLAPHVMRAPDDFNADKMKFATENATLRFMRKMVTTPNPKFVSLEATPNIPPTQDICTDSKLVVTKGHVREDLITHVVPVHYDATATCPRWLAFLTAMLPDPAVRRLVQVSSGLGLVGVTVQRLFFHYGDGANGKSVYMETLCRLLGEVSVTLPSTSLIGEGGSSGGASPDLARLYGRRMLRVKELPEGEDLRENLVKELTGGEMVTARDLFAGYMDFLPLFIAMMSGNGYPRITGTDDGIWRRMAVVHWPIKVPKDERREFEEIVSSFDMERAGILNWLIDGVHIFLKDGLVIPEAVEKATQDYRDDQDRTAAFVARCVVRDDQAAPLQARVLYQAYCDFTIDEGGRPMTNTAFGRAMSKKFKKETGGHVVQYIGIRLVDVPAPKTASTQGDYGQRKRSDQVQNDPFPDEGL